MHLKIYFMRHFIRIIFIVLLTTVTLGGIVPVIGLLYTIYYVHEGISNVNLTLIHWIWVLFPIISGIPLYFLVNSYMRGN